MKKQHTPAAAGMDPVLQLAGLSLSQLRGNGPCVAIAPDAQTGAARLTVVYDDIDGTRPVIAMRITAQGVRLIEADGVAIGIIGCTFAQDLADDIAFVKRPAALRIRH